MTDLLGIIPKWAKLNVNSSRDAWKQMIDIFRNKLILNDLLF